MPELAVDPTPQDSSVTPEGVAVTPAGSKNEIIRMGACDADICDYPNCPCPRDPAGSLSVKQLLDFGGEGGEESDR